MSYGRDGAHVRIASVDPRSKAVQHFCGMGLLVTPDRVVTCAHVVAAALSHHDVAADQSQAPDMPVHLDFPVVAAGDMRIAMVEHWVPDIPPDRDPVEICDLAVLRLESERPAQSQLAKLSTGDGAQKDFMALGAPEHSDSLCANSAGRVLGRMSGGFIELDVNAYSETPSQRLQDGFSGGGVWVDDLNGFVAMVKGVKEDSGRALTIPVEHLIAVVEHADPEAFLDLGRVRDPVVYLVDRRDESRAVAKALLEVEARKGDKSPVLFFIEGGDLDGHHAFVERFRSLKRCAFLRPDVPRTVPAEIHDCDWARGREEGFPALCDSALKLLDPEAQATDDIRENAIALRKAINDWRQPLAFELHLDAGTFEPADRNLLLDWLELWDTVGERDLREIVVLFMCVYHEEPDGDGKSPLRAHVKELENSQSTLIVRSIPLSRVDRKDVEAWLNGSVRKLRPGQENTIDRLIKLLPREFQDPVISMERLIAWDEVKPFT